MSRDTGNHYENYACDFLQQQGLTCLYKNFRSRFGEIDLIMQHQQTLVFVEVKYRRSANFGSSAESVTYQKQQRLLTTANLFLRYQPHFANYPMRFDVMALRPSQHQTSEPAIEYEWIQAAFH
jgi:putative endonuclease